jgi:hypothetical protein
MLVGRTKNTNPLSHMAKKLQDCDKFKFLSERSVKERKIEFTRWHSAQLRAKLPRGIYWIQIAEKGSIQWNWTILQDYLINGKDRPEHQALIEEYLATLS